MKQLCFSGALVLVCTATPAQALNCVSQVSHIYTDRNGAFLILAGFRGEWLQICSLDAAWKGISQEVCKTWISTVMTGMSTGRGLNLHYSDISACNSIPSYGNAPSPNYVMMVPQ